MCCFLMEPTEYEEPVEQQQQEEEEEAPIVWFRHRRPPVTLNFFWDRPAGAAASV